MRNRWHPRSVARYAVGDELRAIKDGKIKVERDPEFTAEKFKASQAARAAAKNASIANPVVNVDDEARVGRARRPLNIESLDVRFH